METNSRKTKREVLRLDTFTSREEEKREREKNVCFFYFNFLVVLYLLGVCRWEFCGLWEGVMCSWLCNITIFLTDSLSFQTQYLHRWKVIKGHKAYPKTWGSFENLPDITTKELSTASPSFPPPQISQQTTKSNTTSHTQWILPLNHPLINDISGSPSHWPATPRAYSAPYALSSDSLPRTAFPGCGSQD